MNKFAERDALMSKKFTDKKYIGGIRRFEGLTIKDINELAKIGCIRLQGQHNDSPTVDEILQFMNFFKDKNITAHGFVEEEKRQYPFLSIEGVEYKGPVDSKLQASFATLFRKADTFEITDKGFYCWYD